MQNHKMKNQIEEFSINLFYPDYAFRVAKRAFKLAWDACGGTTGLGFLQDIGEVGEEEIWEIVFQNSIRADENHAYLMADYLFGRMVKLNIELDGSYLRVIAKPAAPDYQAWCRRYSTYKDLLGAALGSVNEGISLPF